MKYVLFVIGLMVTSAAIADHNGPDDEAPHTITFCYENKQLLPHFVGNTSSIPAHNPGGAIDVIQALDKALPNVSFELVRYPWSRCLKELETGNVQSVIGRFTEMRAAYAAYPRTIDGDIDKTKAFSRTTACFLYHKDFPIEWDGNNLVKPDDIILSVTRGYQMAADLKLRGFEVYETKSSNLAHDLLFNHRVQASLGNCNEPNLPKDVVELKQPYFENYGFLMLNKVFAVNHPDIAGTIWSALTQIDKDAHYKKYQH